MADQAAQIKALEERVKALELENAEKDAVIKRLSAGAATDAAAPPTAPGGLNESYLEFIVYEDDAALGEPCPSLESLQVFNGEPVNVGNGKVTVITFFSKLNKSDFCTLTRLTQVAEHYGDKIQVLAISRDGESTDVSRWVEKFQDKFFGELSGADGSAGVTVQAHFPLAFDADGAVNAEFKKLAKKAVVGVGFTFLLDGAGVIRWTEVFVRGQSIGQFDQQLANLVEGKPLISNGKAPVVEEATEEVGDFEDPYAAAGDGY